MFCHLARLVLSCWRPFNPSVRVEQFVWIEWLERFVRIARFERIEQFVRIERFERIECFERNEWFVWSERFVPSERFVETCTLLGYASSQG
jgi:hypothetical protein